MYLFSHYSINHPYKCRTGDMLINFIPLLSTHVLVTHWAMNKMGCDFAGDSLKWISIEKHAFLFIFAMDFVPSGPVDIASALKHALV